MDVVDFDRAVEEILDATGFPASCLRDPKMVEAIRQQRNQQMAQQQQLEAAPAIAKTAAALSKAPEAGSALQMLLGQGTKNA